MTEVKLDFDKQGGLVPVIVTDYKTGQVLMLAYMNELSYQLTLETKQMHYWSRSEMSFGIREPHLAISNMSKASRQIVIRTPCLSLWNKKEQPAIQEPTAVSLRIYMMTIKIDRSSYVRNTL